MAHVIAIPSTPALVNSTEDFINAVTHDRQDSADRFIHMVDFLTDRVLSLFLVEPSQMTQMSNTQQKIIDFAVTTSGKASHMLTRQIFKKISNAEFAPVLASIQSLYKPGDEEKGVEAHTEFAVPDDFARDFKDAAALCAAGKGRDNVAAVSDAMNTMSDLIIDELFVANTKLIKIGFVTQKALNVGVEGSRKAVHAVNKKVLRDLSNDELKGYMAHYEPLVQAR